METSTHITNGHEEWIPTKTASMRTAQRPLRLVRNDDEPTDPTDRAVVDLHAAALRLRAATRKLASLNEEAGGTAFLPSLAAAERAHRALGDVIDRLPDGPTRGVVRVGGLEIIPSQRVARYNERTLTLSRKEFDLLCHLAQNPHAMTTKVDLLRDVWGYVGRPITRTVDSHAARLRGKIVAVGALEGVFVINHWGTGYSLLHHGR